MPRVVFTQNLQRHIATEPQEIAAGSLSEALDRVFQLNPKLKGYVLDDQGAVRKHVTIFIDGNPISDRTRLTDPLTQKAEVYVMQALSGG